jgi:hypothetical protein
MNTTRVLTTDDIPQVLEVIYSNDTWYHGVPMDHEFMTRFYTMPYYYDRVKSQEKIGLSYEMFGLFDENNQLDSYALLLYPPDLSCRADTPGERELSVFLEVRVTRKLPNRIKNQYGFDVNSTEMLIEVNKYFEKQGLWTNWVLVDLPYFRNPGKHNKVLIDAIRGKYVKTDFIIPPGERRGDPEAQFINTWIARHPAPSNREARCISLKPEFRK